MIEKFPLSLILQKSKVSLDDRMSLFKSKPLTIWLTGLSAAGKSTIAYSLERRLIDLGYACYVLDGDNIRYGLNNDLDFSKGGRAENIRRVSEVAKLMNDAGLIVIAAFISPFINDRAMARLIIGQDYFREVYISTTLSVCESRDPKGLYKKAKLGVLNDFTGVSSAYEPPQSADLILDTEKFSIEESVRQILRQILIIKNYP